jgi:hypothetical protein
MLYMRAGILSKKLALSIVIMISDWRKCLCGLSSFPRFESLSWGNLGLYDGTYLPRFLINYPSLEELEIATYGEEIDDVDDESKVLTLQRPPLPHLKVYRGGIDEFISLSWILGGQISPERVEVPYELWPTAEVDVYDDDDRDRISQLVRRMDYLVKRIHRAPFPSLSSHI